MFYRVGAAPGRCARGGSWRLADRGLLSGLDRSPERPGDDRRYVAGGEFVTDHGASRFEIGDKRRVRGEADRLGDGR
jgi:hypothetical protein